MKRTSEYFNILKNGAADEVIMFFLRSLILIQSQWFVGLKIENFEYDEGKYTPIQVD